uniref:Uncharacterized protein n=1 Tax=Anopheles quadriannulatus TaxID=34691 RepID=A0A182XTK6_ANOQN
LCCLSYLFSLQLAAVLLLLLLQLQLLLFCGTLFLFGCVHPAAQNTHIRGRSVPCVLYLPFCASWRNQSTTKGSPFLPRSAPTFYSTHRHT